MSVPTGSPAGLAVACAGGVVADTKLQPLDPLRRGTSNPARALRTAGGVARNVAENLGRLGLEVRLLSAAGDDGEGDRLLAELAAAGVDVGGVRRSHELPTASYTALLDERGELLYGLADTTLLDRLDDAWARWASERMSDCPLWFVDANLPAAVLTRLLRGCPPGARLAADPVSIAKAPRLAPLLDRIDLLFPDRGELEVLSGSARSDPAGGARRLRDAVVSTVIVTLGADGLLVADRRGDRFYPALPARVRDVTGAGDALVAGVLWALAAGAAGDPLRWGLAAAALTVESDATVRSDLSPGRLAARLAKQPAPETAGA